MDELAEAHHVLVVVDERVHVAELHVPDAVVDLEQVLARCRRGRVTHLVIARCEGPGIVGSVDEAVDDLAVGVDGAAAQDALLARHLGRLQVRARAA